MEQDEPRKGEVWLARVAMPSSDHAGWKRRPVLVVSQAPPSETDGVVLVAAISSSTFRLTDFDIQVRARTRLGRSMGLRRDSAIFCGILQAMSVAELERQIGEIDTSTQELVNTRIKQLIFGPAPG